MSKLKRTIRQKTEPPQRTKPSLRETRRTHQDIPAGAPPGFGSRRAELERMWREQFPKRGREERIRRALEALQEMNRNPIGPNLDLETVKKIAEDPDLWEF
jgi:hypothetical protein